MPNDVLSTIAAQRAQRAETQRALTGGAAHVCSVAAGANILRALGKAKVERDTDIVSRARR